MSSDTNDLEEGGTDRGEIKGNQLKVAGQQQLPRPTEDHTQHETRRRIAQHQRRRQPERPQCSHLSLVSRQRYRAEELEVWALREVLAFRHSRVDGRAGGGDRQRRYAMTELAHIPAPSEAKWVSEWRFLEGSCGHQYWIRHFEGRRGPALPRRQARGISQARRGTAEDRYEHRRSRDKTRY